MSLLTTFYCNYHGLASLLILGTFVLFIAVYLSCVVYKDVFILENEMYLFKYGEKMKKFTPYILEGKLLYEDGFDLWSLSHIILFFTIGLLFPGEIIFIIILSLLFEYYEAVVGLRGRFSDIILNIIGYTIGNMIQIDKMKHIRLGLCNFIEPYSIYIIPIGIILFILLAVMLQYKPKNKNLNCNKKKLIKRN